MIIQDTSQSQKSDKLKVEVPLTENLEQTHDTPPKSSNSQIEDSNEANMEPKIDKHQQKGIHFYLKYYFLI